MRPEIQKKNGNSSNDNSKTYYVDIGENEGIFMIEA